MTFNQALYDAHIDAMRECERARMAMIGLRWSHQNEYQAYRNANRLAAYKRKRQAI